jgi:hypothetical protein
MEEKLSDVSATLAEEEEKAKHLLKLKAKHESTIGMRRPCQVTFPCNISLMRKLCIYSIQCFGSGIREKFFSILDPFFRGLNNNFWVKITSFLLSIGSNFQYCETDR